MAGNNKVENDATAVFVEILAKIGQGLKEKNFLSPVDIEIKFDQVEYTKKGFVIKTKGSKSSMSIRLATRIEPQIL